MRYAAELDRRLSTAPPLRLQSITSRIEATFAHSSDSEHRGLVNISRTEFKIREETSRGPPWITLFPC
jgi:hypothetical protein